MEFRTLQLMNQSGKLAEAEMAGTRPFGGERYAWPDVPFVAPSRPLKLVCPKKSPPPMMWSGSRSFRLRVFSPLLFHATAIFPLPDGATLDWPSGRGLPSAA